MLREQNNRISGVKISLFFICALIVWTPLARGGAPVWARGMIQIFVLMALISLIWERKWPASPSPFFIPMGFISLLVILSAWRSPHPAGALEGAGMFFTYLTLFSVSRQVVQTRKAQRTVIYTIIGTAVLIGVIGLLKTGGITPFSWWVYPELNYKAGFMSGPYGNHNHMAGFLEMAIPFVLILFLMRSRSVERTMGLVVLTLFLLIVQGMTLSRGGWSATAASLIFMLLFLLSRKRFKRKRLLMGITVTVAVIGVILLSSTPVVDRLLTLTEEDTVTSLNGRKVCWQGAMAMIENNLLTGTGPGTFAMAYPQYQPPGLAVLFHHAHNDYLEMVANVGIGVIPILLWMIILFFKTGFDRMRSPSRQVRGIALGTLSALIAMLLHSAGDFNLQIPANAILFTIICALGASPK